MCVCMLGFLQYTLVQGAPGHVIIILGLFPYYYHYYYYHFSKYKRFPLKLINMHLHPFLEATADHYYLLTCNYPDLAIGSNKPYFSILPSYTSNPCLKTIILLHTPKVYFLFILPNCNSYPFSKTIILIHTPKLYFLSILPNYNSYSYSKTILFIHTPKL